MEASMRLWELGDELERIGFEIFENEGELTPELEARLDALEGAWEDKVERVALYVRSQVVLGLAADIEVCRLDRIKRSHERAADSLKSYLLREMERMGKSKVETARARVRVQANGGKAVIRWTGEPDAIPDGFRRVEIYPDGAAVQHAHREGTLPDGFVVEARGKHIRIE